MDNYIIVLFKNKKRKKIINKFKTFKRAKLVYDSMIRDSENVIFETLFEKGVECKYELGLIEKNKTNLIPVYLTDEMGRNIKVKLEENGMTLFQISNFKKEELIYNIKNSKRLSLKDIIKNYLNGSGLKMISSLNNKIIIQNDEKIEIFSLKNEFDSQRFINNLSVYFQKIKRNDCLFVKDVSVAQKKYLYELLEKNGFDKKILYRKFTTFPRSSSK